MNHDQLIHHLDRTLIIILILSAPVLLVAAAVGLIVGLLQAVTQIQDQALPQTMKIVAILLTIAALGAGFAGILTREAQSVFDTFPALASSDVGS